MNFLSFLAKQELRIKNLNFKMKDLITALGLLLFIEGLFFAIFPTRVKNMLKSIEGISPSRLRGAGTFFLLLGFLIVWYIKN